MDSIGVAAGGLAAGAVRHMVRGGPPPAGSGQVKGKVGAVRRMVLLACGTTGATSVSWLGPALCGTRCGGNRGAVGTFSVGQGRRCAEPDSPPPSRHAPPPAVALLVLRT